MPRRPMETRQPLEGEQFYDEFLLEIMAMASGMIDGLEGVKRATETDLNITQLSCVAFRSPSRHHFPVRNMCFSHEGIEASGI